MYVKCTRAVWTSDKTVSAKCPGCGTDRYTSLPGSNLHTKHATTERATSAALHCIKAAQRPV